MDVVEETVLAPAKINLALRVLGQRADGYHLLDSLIVPIDLYDQLCLRLAPPRLRDAVTLEVDPQTVPSDSTNLAYRAATLLLAAVERPPAVHIRLVKRIPIGSGLGGGSSDAAAVLLALNRLLGRPLSLTDLRCLAKPLGADVSFFLYGTPARVRGIGEQVTPVTMPTAMHFVLCWPGFALSTALVYSRFNAASLTTAAPATNIANFIDGRRPLSELLVNDLEAAAAQIQPEVLSLKVKLVKEGALSALMTGSGSAVFGVWPDLPSAQDAAMRLRQQGLWAMAVQTLKESPAITN